MHLFGWAERRRKVDCPIGLECFLSRSQQRNRRCDANGRGLSWWEHNRMVKITVTFDQISEAAKQDLAHYVRHGELVITSIATFDAQMNKAPVIQLAGSCRRSPLAR